MRLEWEQIDSSLSGYIWRVKVVGGWLVMSVDDVLKETDKSRFHEGIEWRSSITFVPDPLGQWR
jgi:hypothetical protein